MLDMEPGDVGAGLGISEEIVAAIALVGVRSLASGFGIDMGSEPCGMSANIEPALDLSEVSKDGEC